MNKLLAINSLIIFIVLQHSQVVFAQYGLNENRAILELEEIEERKAIAEFYKNPGEYLNLSTLTTEDYEELTQGIAELGKEQLEEMQSMVFGLTGGVSGVSKVGKVWQVTKIGRSGSILKKFRKAQKVATIATKTRTIRMTEEAIQKAIQYASLSNKLKHVFGKAGRGFDNLLKQFGSEENVIREVVKNLGEIPESGFFEVTRKIGDTFITTRGEVIDGIAKIGTMFIAK